jgi:hypothetical protein
MLFARHAMATAGMVSASPDDCIMGASYIPPLCPLHTPLHASHPSLAIKTRPLLLLPPNSNPDLEESLLSYFGAANVTPAHLKMADTPEEGTVLVPYNLDSGEASPFPLVACRNVFILPGEGLGGRV